MCCSSLKGSSFNPGVNNNAASVLLLCFCRMCFCVVLTCHLCCYCAVSVNTVCFNAGPVQPIHKLPESTGKFAKYNISVVGPGEFLDIW